MSHIADTDTRRQPESARVWAEISRRFDDFNIFKHLISNFWFYRCYILLWIRSTSSVMSKYADNGLLIVEFTFIFHQIWCDDKK